MPKKKKSCKGAFKAGMRIGGYKKKPKGKKKGKK